MDPLWTQDDIDALKAAIRTGVLSVSYDGPPRRTLTYQSLAEMRSLLAAMVSEVSRATGGRAYTLGATKKGFGC